MDKRELSSFYADGSLISYYGFVDTLLPVHQERSQEFVCRGLHFFLWGAQPKRETWLSLIYIDLTLNKNRIELEIEIVLVNYYLMFTIFYLTNTPFNFESSNLF